MLTSYIYANFISPRLGNISALSQFVFPPQITKSHIPRQEMATFLEEMQEDTLAPVHPWWMNSFPPVSLLHFLTSQYLVCPWTLGSFTLDPGFSWYLDTKHIVGVLHHVLQKQIRWITNYANSHVSTRARVKWKYTGFLGKVSLLGHRKI